MTIYFMINDILQHRWQQFREDADAPAKIKLRRFLSRFILTVDKSVIDGTQVSNFIRKIPNVTVVSKETVGVEEKTHYRAIYQIKFVLEDYEDMNTYIVKVLKKSLLDIPGIRVGAYKGTERIDQNG